MHSGRRGAWASRDRGRQRRAGARRAIHPHPGVRNARAID